MAEPFAFNPLDPETRRDPYPLYARARREFPVYSHEGFPVFSVFRYEDVQSILKDSATWSSDFSTVRDLGRADDIPPPSMLGTDPPAHTRLRSLVNQAFTPRIVRRLEPRMREITDELLDRALESRTVDLVQALTYPLPVTVIAELVGIPAADRAQFKEWSDAAIANLGLVFFTGPDPGRVERQRRLLDEMRAYFVPLAAERRRFPREDLLSGLVASEIEGSKLSHEEMLSMLVLLLVAGNETTTTLIGNTVLELLAHPLELARLRENPGLLANAIDEVVRFSSPVQMDPRRPTRPVEIHGVKIPENHIVLSWIGSANRDEAVFERADVFDVGREKNPHIGFGFGVHYCLGANLARLEAQVAIGRLLARTRRFERVDHGPLPLHPSPVFRGVTKLPLALEAA